MELSERALEALAADAGGRRSLEQNVLAEIARLALADQRLDRVFEAAVAGLAAVPSADAGTLCELDDDGTLLVRACFGVPVEVVGRRVPLRGLVRLALDEDDAVLVPDYRERRDLEPPPIPGGLAVRSGLAVAIRGRGRVFGTLALYARRPGALGAPEISFVRAVANVVAQAVARSRVESRAAHQAMLLERVGEAVVAIDLDGRVTAWNRAAERVYGWREDEALGRPLRELLQTTVLTDTHEDSLRAVLETGHWEGEARQRRQDGSFVTVMSKVVHVPAGEHAQAALVAINRDVTRERELEEQLHQAQKMEAIGQLAGGIAHDFNNILTAISGYTELALARDDLDGELRTDLAEVHRAAGRAASLTEQLLLFSRRRRAHPRPLDLNAEVDETQRLLQRLIGEHIVVETELAPALPLVGADPAQVEQVLINLAVNARDAMPDGGTVRIETAEVRLGADRFVRLSVSDTGEGIDEHVLPHVFEPFFTTKGVGVGTGLGLAVVYGIAEQGGGFVEIDSTPGAGTTVSLLLPALRPQSDDAAEAEAAPVTGHETVLLVEDEPTVRCVARTMLERHGYAVVAAGSGDEALAACARHRPDVVVTDVVMPGMSGPSLAEELARRLPGVPVVHVSGYPEATLPAQAQPAIPLMRKPFRASELAVAVRRALDEVGAAR